MKKSRLLAAVCACFITYFSLPANAAAVASVVVDQTYPTGEIIYSTADVYAAVTDRISDGSGYMAFARAEPSWSYIRDAQNAYSSALIDFSPTLDYEYNGKVAASSSTTILYYVGAEYLGEDPNPGRMIPVSIAWALSAIARQSDGDLGLVSLRDNRAAAAIVIGGNAFTARVDARGSSGYLSQTVANSGIENLSFDSIGSLQVQLSTHASLRGDSHSSFSGSAGAMADPVITIDPTWEFADLYALKYTIPEIAQDSRTVSVSTVPVPAAAWLFASGLLGLVGLARRKKVV